MYKILLMFCTVFMLLVFVTEYSRWKRAKRRAELKAKRKAEQEGNK